MAAQESFSSWAGEMPTPESWARVCAFLDRLARLSASPPLTLDWSGAGPALSAVIPTGFPAKVTAWGTNSSYSWVRESPRDGGVEVVPVPQSGTGEGLSGGPNNPAYPAAELPSNLARVPVGTIVWLFPGALGAGYQQWLFLWPLHNLVTCVGPFVTNVQCVNNQIVVTYKYLRIDWAEQTATLVDSCSNNPNPNVVNSGDGSATAGGTDTAVGSGAGVRGVGTDTTTAVDTGISSGGGLTGFGASVAGGTDAAIGSDADAGVGTATGGGTDTGIGFVDTEEH